MASTEPIKDHQSGYVFGFELDGNGAGTPIGATHELGERTCWHHVDFSVAETEAWLHAQGLDPLIIESLVRLDTRPRALKAGNGLLVVLRGINLNPGADPEDMVSLRLWVEPNRVISVRQRRLIAVQELRHRIEAGRGPKDAGELVVAIVEALADRISDFVDASEDRILEHEQAAESGDAMALRTEVSALRRQIAVVRRFLAPQRDAVEAFSRLSDATLDRRDEYSLREQADRFTRYVEDLDLVRERTLVVQEELLNRITQEQNNRMYVLSIVAAVFLPISFISGFFGMNTAGLPGVEEETATALVVLVMVLVTLGIILYFKARRWL